MSFFDKGGLFSQSGSQKVFSFSDGCQIVTFNLICAQFTVLVDDITVLLKMALLFRRNGTSGQRLFNVRKTV